MVDDIVQMLQLYGINSYLEIAHFLAQASHESQHFTKLTEDINYRFANARATYSSYAKTIYAKQRELNLTDKDFCPQPWLFNLVYGGKYGNKQIEDGFLFRGAGIFQLTYKGNYQAFLDWLHKTDQKLDYDIDNIRSYCLTKEGAILSAIWFWLSKGCSILALKDDIVAVTKKINPALKGLDDRKKELQKFKEMFVI